MKAGKKQGEKLQEEKNEVIQIKSYRKITSFRHIKKQQILNRNLKNPHESSPLNSPGTRAKSTYMPNNQIRQDSYEGYSDEDL